MEIQTGENFTREITQTEYPSADSWVVKFSLRGLGGAVDYSMIAGSENKLTLNLTATQTSAILPGAYSYVIYAEKGDDRHRIESGSVTVLKNYLDTDAYDARSECERQLADITAVINKTANSNILQKTIAGRTLSRYPLPDLLVLQSRLRQEVESEKRAARIAAGGSNGLRIRASF